VIVSLLILIELRLGTDERTRQTDTATAEYAALTQRRAVNEHDLMDHIQSYRPAGTTQATILRDGPLALGFVVVSLLR